MPKAKTESLDFETAIETLESLIERLEGGDIPLEKALTEFEQGVALTKQCQKALDKAQKKIDILKEKNGELFTQPFDSQDEG